MNATWRSAITLQKPEDYDLKRSKEAIGSLYPILVDSDGRVIDGMHRQAVDKDWPKQVLPIHGTNSLIARIIANVQRREVSPEEKREWLKELAEKTKWNPDEIAEHIGMSVSWVRKYLDQEYKNSMMSKLASKKHESTRAEKNPWKPTGHTCGKCGSRMELMCVCHNCGEMEECE
jgi:hypothetical protein